MKSIINYTEQEKKDIANLEKKLFEKLYKAGFNSINKQFDDFSRSYGYSQYTFKGKVKQEVINVLGRLPTADEVILMVESYFHFGAVCSINEDGIFHGKVNTD